jgi:DNA-binding NarL/FixJ family response regulator
LIVARIPIIREGLRALLAAEKDLQVSTLTQWEPRTLLLDILEGQPDVVLLDVEVLEREGWDLLSELRNMAPELVLLVIGDTLDDRRIANALALGARGYILRDGSLEEMSTAIRAARLGLYVLHSGAAAALLNQLPRSQRAPADTLPDDREDVIDLIEPLSPRELEVLRLMTRGMANKQIAQELVITEHTVKFHIRAILGKLGAANRTEAVTLALQKGLVTL